MQSSRRKIVRFLIFNLILSIVMIFFSLFLMSFAMDGFKEGLPMTQTQNVLSAIGGVLAKYFMILAFLLPAHLRKSGLTGPLSYISAFITTLPISFIVYYLYRKTFRSKTNIEQ
jgi:hypothetical protein